MPISPQTNNRENILETLDFKSAQEVVDYEEKQLRTPSPESDYPISNPFYTSLSGHIITIFTENRDARRDSGIEEEMLSSIRAFNGEYDPDDLVKIKKQGGSQIYMNLTSTKCRACASWIKDIMMPAKGKSWLFKTSKVKEISPEVAGRIEEALEQEFANFERSLQEEEQQKQQAEAQQQQGPQSSGQQGQTPPQPQGAPPSPPGGAPAAPTPTPITDIAERLRMMNQARRDIEDTIKTEIDLVAKDEMEKLEDLVEDQLQEGEWNPALSEFIEDFTIMPNAFLKGPIIIKKKKLVYVNGMPTTEDVYISLNKRVSALDMYPSANATCINDGDLCEHVRFSRQELSDLLSNKHYNRDAIQYVLQNYRGESSVGWLGSDIESDKAEVEKRGSEEDANKGVIHGIHFFGSASAGMLHEWGLEDVRLNKYADYEEIEIEAILVDNVVIKVKINDDPLLRRPYYTASFQNRPGSFWGRSLPHLMKDIQRMCNASARALSNNMGLASGPQVALITDRLATDGDITDIYPFKIWEFWNDPTGGAGKPIDFMQPSSNASELLAVYKEFELRADDATGIPRYAYGNERTGGAAQTASGLSMLLESASKGIKDAIRHIDQGVIIPRVEYQFYWNLKTNKDLNYTGDVQVVGKGSQALTIKAAEAGKRMEFLQAISGNPQILEVVGPEGIAEVFRAIFQDINLGEVVIPSRLELRKEKKRREEAAAQAQQAQQQAMQEKNQTPVKIVEAQLAQQSQAIQGNHQLKTKELEIKEAESIAKQRAKVQELETRERISASSNTTNAARARAEQEQADRMQRRQMAFDLRDLEKEEPTEGKM